MNDFRIIKRVMTNKEYFGTPSLSKDTEFFLVQKRGFFLNWKTLKVGSKVWKHFFRSEQEAYTALARYVVEGHTDSQVVATYKWKNK